MSEKLVSIKGKKYWIIFQRPFWESKKRWEAFRYGVMFYDYFLVAHSPTYDGLLRKLRKMK